MLPTPIVDSHVHLFPDGFFDAIRRHFEERLGLRVHYRLYYRECVEHLRARGVGTIVYSNYAHKKGVAPVLNEWNLRVLDEIPDLYCYVPFHPEDDDALARTAGLLDHPRILGVKLQLAVMQVSPADPRLFPLYERIIEKRRRILLHVGTGPVRRSGLQGIAPFREVLRRYPDLPASIPHMGGLEFDAFAELLERHPSLLLDTAYSFVPGTPYRYPRENAVLEACRDRILYGSDFPGLIHPREAEIDELLALRLSPDFYRKVFRDNALRLLRDVTGKAEPNEVTS